MTFRLHVATLLALCLFLLSSVTTLSQSQTTGRIVGTVTDEKGGVVPGAEVTVTNKATREARTTVADDSGNYIVPLLPPGAYAVTVKQNGFKKFISEDVKVALTETSTVNATLPVGALTETVTVTAAPSLAQTEDSQMGRVVDTRAVSELPLAT
ncbi:MAG: hypothetical protein QOH96_1350, partial [Blastocatellia bacterium]|nr:hypothetical protein [Blastocatellia bacterium]